MADDFRAEPARQSSDAGDYCRKVESYLTRVNGGHLVRIVGPGFELVRSWADEGVPLTVVYRGIDQKAERHAAGQSTRPLRIEFCEADVRETYHTWRRAVGVPAAPETETPDSQDGGTAGKKSRRPSLSKHLDRVIDRLGHLTGRLDISESFRDAIVACLEQLTAIRDVGKNARGTARDEIEARLAALDGELMARAHETASPALLEKLGSQAAEDLAPFRGRLSADAWTRAIDVTVARLLRSHFGLPAVTVE